MAWYHKLWFKFREIFFCCFKDEREKLMGMKGEKEVKEEEIHIEEVKEEKVSTFNFNNFMFE